jgi:glycosyltransferase involved in cell wall biosynthesis
MSELGFAVVIPAFNAQHTLERAVRSALGQTLLPDQILVIDDGSTDATAEIAGALGPRVQCLRQSNSGVAAARNRGIANARAEFVAFLDADDEWLPHHLEQASAVFAADPGLVWYSAAYERRELGGPIFRSSPPARLLEGGIIVRDYFEAAMAWTSYTPTMIVRRGALTDMGGFDVGMPTAEDLDLWFRLALDHPRIGWGPRISVIIHDTAGSLTKQGRFTHDRAGVLAEKWERLARERGRDHEAPLRSYLLRCIEDLLRVGLRLADRTSVRWVSTRFGAELPMRWRLLAAAGLVTPDLVWKAVSRAWLRSQRLRNRLRR